MKVQTFDKARVEEKTLRLKVADSYSGSFTTVRAVDDRGDTLANILMIDENGITMVPSVSQTLGLPLDADGRVKVQGLVSKQVISLLEPIVKFFQARVRLYGGELSHYVMLELDGAAVTFGDMRRLVEFYNANK